MPQENPYILDSLIGKKSPTLKLGVLKELLKILYASQAIRQIGASRVFGIGLKRFGWVIWKQTYSTGG